VRRHLIGFLLLAGTLAGCGSDGDAGEPLAPVASQARAPLPAPSRTEVSGVFWDRKVVVLAGLLADNSASAQVDFYDPAADRWSPGPPLTAPLHHTAVGVLGDRLYVVGGYTGVAGTWTPVADVRSLGPGETRWRTEPPLAGPRGALALATLDDVLVAVGGVGSGQQMRTEILRRGAAAWEAGPDLPHPTEHLAATGFDGRAYAIAGRYQTLEGNLDTVHSLAPGDKRWRKEPKLNHTRGGIGAATPGRPCVAGGEEPAGTIASIECLVDGRWRDVATLTIPRHGIAVAADGNRFHVIGGGPKPSLFVSDAHEVFEIP
jgi:hypothetical protein